SACPEGLVPLCEESILSAMRPRFPGTLRQPTGIPDRWASWGPFLGTLDDSVARSAEIGLKPWLTGAAADEVRTVRRLDFAAVQRLGRIRDLIEPFREALRRGAHAPPRTQHQLTESVNPETLLMMPAWRRGGPIGVKLVTVFPEKARQGTPTLAGGNILFVSQRAEA